MRQKVIGNLLITLFPILGVLVTLGGLGMISFPFFTGGLHRQKLAGEEPRPSQ